MVNSYQGLQEKFEKNVKKLQSSCKHPRVYLYSTYANCDVPFWKDLVMCCSICEKDIEQTSIYGLSYEEYKVCSRITGKDMSLSEGQKIIQKYKNYKKSERVEEEV